RPSHSASGREAPDLEFTAGTLRMPALRALEGAPRERTAMNAFKPSLLFAALFAVGLAGCDRNDDDVAGPPDLVPPAATEPDIDTPPPAGVDLPPAGGEGVLTLGMHDDGGQYIVDRAGSALYMLEDDEDGSGCTDDCLEVWPPVLVNDVQASIDPATTLDAGMLGRIERADGT